MLYHNVIKQYESQNSILLTKKLDPTIDLYLKDYVLDGKPVLPAAMAMELMTEAVADAWPDFTITEIKKRISALR